MKEIFDINMNDPRSRALFLSQFGLLRGPVRITAETRRRHVTNPQRAYYFQVLVRAYQKYFLAQGQVFSLQLCHEMLKRKLLERQPVYDKRTGELLYEQVGSIADSGDVNASQMTDYMERVKVYLTELEIDIGEEVPHAHHS